MAESHIQLVHCPSCGEALPPGDEKKDEPESPDQGSRLEQIDYPSVGRVALITFSLALCCFCVALDNTILATAIPRISQDFDSIDDISWYASSYLLVSSAFILSFGKVYTYYSVKWTFLASLAFFELGSLICATTPTSTGLIIGRSIAGLGSAGLLPGSMIILTQIAPLRQRPLLNSVIGIMSGIAAVAGPLLGGVLTEQLTWRWCFYINLPFGGVTAISVTWLLRSQTVGALEGGIAKRLDLIGIIIFIPAVVSLLLALQWGGAQYPWGSARIIALLVVAGVLGVTWIAIQACREDDATIPPRLIKQRNIMGAAIYAILFSGAFMAMSYYLPTWFQAVKGASAAKSGIMSLPLVGGMIVCSVLVTAGIGVVGYMVPFLILGAVILAIGAAMCTLLKVQSGHPEWIGYQAMVGIGAGLGYQLPSLVVQATVSSADISVALAITTFMQYFGCSVFVSLGQTVFQNQLFTNLHRFAPNVDPSTVTRGGITGFRNVVDPTILHSILEAYNASITQAFYLAVAAGALSLVGASLITPRLSMREGKD